MLLNRLILYTAVVRLSQNYYAFAADAHAVRIFLEEESWNDEGDGYLQQY